MALLWLYIDVLEIEVHPKESNSNLAPPPPSRQISITLEKTGVSISISSFFLNKLRAVKSQNCYSREVNCVIYFLKIKDHKCSLLSLYEFVLKYLPQLVRCRTRAGGVPVWIKLIIWALCQGEPLPSCPICVGIAMVEMKLCQHTLLSPGRGSFVVWGWERTGCRRLWQKPRACLLLLTHGQLVGSDTNLSLILVLHCNNMPAVPVFFCDTAI